MNRPIRSKLAIIFISAGSLVAFVMLVALAFVESTFSRRTLEGDFHSVAGVLSLNLQASVDFDDPDAAEAILSGLTRKEDVDYAEVRLGDGSLFARFGAESPEADRAISEIGAEASSVSLLSGRIVVAEPIRLADDSEGARLYVVGNMSNLYRNLTQKGLLAGGIMLAASLLAYLFASRFGQILTRPILELAETAGKISKGLDFSERQEKRYEDETGQLVEAFNEMLDEVEHRDGIIRSNEERFRGYFELGVVGMAIIDQSGRWIEANGQLFTILGADRDTVLGSRFEDWLACPETSSQSSLFKSFTELCDPVYMGDFWMGKGGSREVFVIVSARRIREHGEQEDRFIVLLQNITDRKRSEEALLASKLAAEEANRSKNEFLSIMSHELRTPLNPIIGFVDLLLLQEPEEESEKMLQLIRNSSEHLLSLIDDILEYSRAQSGRLELAHISFGPQELFAKIVNIIRPSANDRSITLSMDLVEFGPYGRTQRFYGDPGRIRQVALNLLSNAIKYNRPDGTVDVNVSIREGEDGWASLLFSVEDTGIGIDEGKHDYIFEPFTQLDMSLQRKHEGLGLGLAISRQIVQEMGGEIKLRSCPEIGSTFTVEIPVELDAKSRRGLGDSRQGEAFRDSMNIRGKRVLLVEDDRYNKELMDVVFRRMGLNYEWAENGLAALERVNESKYDLVLMDIRMPMMDGLEAAQRIRAMEGDRDRRPIIAMTAHSSAEMKEQCIQAGMDDYLPKPVNYIQLEKCLRRYLGRSAL